MAEEMSEFEKWARTWLRASFKLDYDTAPIARKFALEAYEAGQKAEREALMCSECKMALEMYIPCRCV